MTPESKDLVQDILREDYQGAAATAAGEEEEDVEGVDSATSSTSVSSPLKDAPWEPQPWSNEGIGTRRCGVLALKIGVVPQWLKDGTRVTCTMFQILDCHVINYTSPEEWDRQFSYHKYHRIAGRVLRGLQGCKEGGCRSGSWRRVRGCRVDYNFKLYYSVLILRHSTYALW